MNKLKIVASVFVLFYLLILLYFAIKIQQKDKIIQELSGGNGEKIVEIWGKAAIGNFLWEEILNGNLEENIQDGYQYGELSVNDVTFRYRTGPGVIPSKVPQEVENLVLVLNGRSTSKVEYAQMWLTYIPAMESVQNVIIVLLGNEECKNTWLIPFLSTHQGYVKAVFLVYDSVDIDNTVFYQWPLGVATYRHFPRIPPSNLHLNSPRRFRCNFLGTVYPNSSRELMMKVITQHQLQQQCYVKPRLKWLPQETKAGMYEYTQALINSDLTLSPVGKNSESYRIYEAMSLGSVPVIEDVLTPGECGSKHIDDNTPYRLLKRYHAPLIYIKTWNELPALLERESLLTLEEVVARRKIIIKWYHDFKIIMKNKFYQVVGEKLLH